MRHEVRVLRLTVCHVELIHMLLWMVHVRRIRPRMIENLLSGRLTRVVKLVLYVVHLCGMLPCRVGTGDPEPRERGQDLRNIYMPRTASKED